MLLFEDPMTWNQDIRKKILYCSVKIGSKCLYALAAILRNFPEAQHVFIESGGIEVFQKIFNTDESQQLNKIKIKILTLVQV